MVGAGTVHTPNHGTGAETFLVQFGVVCLRRTVTNGMMFSEINRIFPWALKSMW